MKKLVAATIAMIALGIGSALAEDLEFVLTNTSNADIVAFHVSHAGTDSWEENLLAGGYLPSGNEITIVIADGRDVCEYDIRTEFSDGHTFEDFGLNLCEMGSYTFE